MTSQNVCCDKAYTSVMQPNGMGYTVTVIVLHNYHSNGLTHLWGSLWYPYPTMTTNHYYVVQYSTAQYGLMTQKSQSATSMDR